MTREMVSIYPSTMITSEKPVSFLSFFRLLMLNSVLLLLNTAVSLVFLYFAKSDFSSSLPPNATT